MYIVYVEGLHLRHLNFATLEDFRPCIMILVINIFVVFFSYQICESFLECFWVKRLSAILFKYDIDD